ncbi:MAG: PAS domain S-box protein [Desulfosudis oleivorans]|nr:PAS domain S-box protein [Desulfosudis oleivorans]
MKTAHKEKDGAFIPVEMKVHIDIFQGKKVLVAIVQDIFGKKENESLKEKYTQIFENLWNEVCILNPEDFTYLYVNKTLLTNCGYQLEELIGHTVSIVTPSFYA